MAVSNLHESYAYRVKDWQKIRDCIEGDKAIKSRGTAYIPRLTDQDDPSYNTYLNRVNFMNATARTVDALVGLIFAKDAIIETPLSDLELESITNKQQSLSELAKELTTEVLTMGRVGILIDATAANVEARINGKSYISVYKTEDIINWKYVDNKPSLIVLREIVNVDTDDEFAQKKQTNYRVLDVTDGKYRQRLFTPNSDDGFAVDEIFPKIKGKSLTEIPFVAVGIESFSLEPDKSPILDLVDTNITHFKFDIDRGNALHFIGVPTPYITGHHPEENEKIRLGSDTFISLPETDAKIGILELKAEGLGALANYILELENRMAFLGAKMLKDDKNVGESAQAMELKQNSEKAILSSIAKNISMALKFALQYYCDFAGYNSSNISYQLNSNFGTDKLTDAERERLLLEWQGGAITFNTFFNNMQKANIIEKDVDAETYKMQLESEAPVMSVQPVKE